MPQRQNAYRDESQQQGDISVGEILRRARLHYEQSPLDIEKALRIKASQVEAIENNEIEKLPGRVYAIGFVRSYAEYLGLDSEHMVNLFKNQLGAQVVKPELHFPVPASESKLPQSWLAAASLVITLGLVGLWWGINAQDRGLVNNVPAVAEVKSGNGKMGETAGPPKPQTATAQAEPPAEAPAVTAAAPAAAGTEKGIILKIVQNSWVEIKDKDGKEVVSRVLKAGDKYFVPARPDLFMSLGNSGGVKLEVDGKPLPDLGKSGEVLRNVPLDVEYLKNRPVAKSMNQ